MLFTPLPRYRTSEVVTMCHNESCHVKKETEMTYSV